MVDGTLATAVFELESETIAPPEAAGLVRVMVPVPDWPLTIVVGVTETLPRAAGTGFTFNPAVSLTLA